jgi:pullulanase
MRKGITNMKKTARYMRKVTTSFLVMVFVLTSLLPFSVQADEPVTDVYVHYYRYGGDYTGWDLWTWRNQPTSEAGKAFAFQEDANTPSSIQGGVVTKIPLNGDLAGTTQLGIIARKGDWQAKDLDIDRFIDIPQSVVGGELHVYLVEGDIRIGYGKDDPSGPDQNPKFKYAYFSKMNTIQFSVTQALTKSNIRIQANGEDVPILSYEADGTLGTIVIDREVDFSKKYEIIGQFSDDFTNTATLTYDGIYDSEAFDQAFGYEGDDLGAYVVDNTTTFRLWAPITGAVAVNIYDTGTPVRFGGSDTPIQTIPLERSDKGTFYVAVEENLHGKYYTYSVTNGSNTFEVIDPYAKSAGINGIRGLIVDFSLTNPEGFTYGARPQNILNSTDAIIYELHIRDLTTHESWNGPDAERGRYMGLVEKGTRYQGVTTGFDHIVEMGVTHVQLLPFFDFGVLDESKINQPEYNSFNWGYMPLNFNVLEGAYSANPYDGLVRIAEMKEVIQDFTDAGIRINMDVVYNHSGLTADSNFNLIVPGYYFRKTESGTFSNGSGTGNETASERQMMRKFIVDSVKFWAKEYNIAGFRFDLMALHDVDTMLQIEHELKKINSTIMVYGEPWMGGTTTLPADKQSGKSNLPDIGSIGAFNDDLRDAVKGSVFNREDKGFLQGTFTNQILNRMRYGIVGGTAHESVNAGSLSNNKIWHTSPLKTINYVTAHDNNTLYDKLFLTLQNEDVLDLIPAMVKQAYGIVLTAQGIPFIHAGDEFMRSKPAANGKGFDHNSYQSPDTVNQLRWDYKARESETAVFNYVKGLIEFRKSHPSFRMTDAEAIAQNVHFLYPEEEGVIAFELWNGASADEYAKMLVIHNANRENVKLNLPKNGGWIVSVNGDVAGEDVNQSYKGGQNMLVSANSTYVLYQDTSIADVSFDPTMMIISLVGGLVLLGGGMVIVYRVRKSRS